MGRLTDFTALIQLIAGVNFAFILGDFLKNALGVLFTSDVILDDKDKELNQSFAVDLDSVNTMVPIVTVDGMSSEETLISLKMSYEELNKDWTLKREKILNQIKEVKDIAGFDTLFLAASAYSVFDLLFIALGGSVDSWMLDVFIMLFNVLTLISFVFYVVRLCKFKAKKIVIEGKWCLVWMLFVLMISVFLASINQLFVLYDLFFVCPMWMCSLLEVILCVVIPFLVLLSSILFVLFYEILFNFQIARGVREITAKQVELREQKSNLDKSYSIFKPAKSNPVTYD